MSKKKKPYKAPACPKCHNKRNYIYCAGDGYYHCEWRLSSQFHPRHSSGEAFHVTCYSCQFKEVLFDVSK